MFIEVVFIINLQIISIGAPATSASKLEFTVENVPKDILLMLWHISFGRTKLLFKDILLFLG